MVVDRNSVPTKTITAALSRVDTSSASLIEIIQLWSNTAVFEERVNIGSNQSNVYIMSAPSFPTNPSINSSQALRVFGAHGIRVLGVDINGDEAVHNTGTLSLMNLMVSSASGPAVYNAGLMYLDNADSRYVRSNTTVIATSGVAIHNAGTIAVMNGTVRSTSAADNDVAIHNTGVLNIYGTTEVSTALGSDGDAIYNHSYDGLLTLGGAPTITGRIVGFRAGRVGVLTSGTGNYRFNPGTRRYALAPADLKNGDIVVAGGANFINNFELVNTNLSLAVRRNNLIATSSLLQLFVSKISTIYRNIMDAVFSVGSGQEIVITDHEIYEEQVTIHDTLSEITMRSNDSLFFYRPRIRFSRIGPNNAPQAYAGLTERSSASIVIGNTDIEANSTVRIFGARGILIDGIDIEGENAVYNTGDVAVRNGTLSATSYYAIYNTGAAEITNATVSTESDYAIYNIGTLYIVDGAVSSASDGAIYNHGDNGRLILAGSPTITGRIAGFGAGKISVITTAPNVFAPDDKKYLLAPANLMDGDTVVIGGANFINSFELADTNFTLVASGDNLAAHKLFDTLTVAAVSTERVIIPSYEPHIGARDVFSVDVPLDGFSAGPIPVSKRTGGVSFFWQGSGIKTGTLYVYGSTGNLVKKISIRDKARNTQDKRKVGEWDLTGSNKRPVSEGSYAVKGTIVTIDGKKEKVAVVLGVR
jgi:hypothetical protein